MAPGSASPSGSPPSAKDEFAFGTASWTDELPLTVKLAAGVSASPTVKPIVLEGVSSLVTVPLRWRSSAAIVAVTVS